MNKWGRSGRRGLRSKKAMRTIGALALAIGFVIIGGSALANEQVCPGLDSGKIDEPGKKTQKTVTAPDGQLIDQYCVKAGSANQGYGPELRTVNPPQKSVTISHSSGKDISHYSLSYVAVEGEPDPEPTEEPDPEPTEEPDPEPTEEPSPKPDEECEEEEEGDEEGGDEGEEDEEGDEECEEPDSEPTTPPTTPPTNNPGGQSTTTPPASQPVTQPAAQPVTQPAPQPVPVAGLPATESKSNDKDDVLGVVVTRSSAKSEALPATLAFTGPRDQLPILWALAGLFLTTGAVLQILGRRRAKEATT